MTDTATLSIKVDSRAVRRADTDLDDFSQSANRAERSTEGFTRETRRGQSALSGFSGAAKGARAAIVAYVSAVGAGKVKDAVDQYTNLTNRLKQVTDGSAELTSVTEDLFRVAEQSRSNVDATVTLYQKLALSSEQLGLTQAELVGLTDTINKSFALSGATADEAAGAIRQLGQGLASGALRGDEFNSVAEQAPGIMRAIARETGFTIGELREFAAEGGITADIVVSALQNASSEINQSFSQTTGTFDQAIQQINNDFVRWAGSSEVLNEVISDTGDILMVLADAAMAAGDVILFAVKGWMELWEVTKDLVKSGLEFAGVLEGINQVGVLLDQNWKSGLITTLGLVANGFLTVAEFIAQPFIAAAAVVTKALGSIVDTLIDALTTLSEFTGVAEDSVSKLQDFKINAGTVEELMSEFNKRFDRSRDIINEFTFEAAKSVATMDKKSKVTIEVAQAQEKATASTRKTTKQLREEAKAAAAAAEAEQEYQKRLQSVIDSADPAAAAIRRVSDQIDTLFEALVRGDISKADFERYSRLLGESLEEAGEDSAKKVSSGFENAAGDISRSLQDAIISGDYEGIGQAIGGVLAAELSSEVSTGIADAIGGAAGGVVGQLGGAVVGGLIGKLTGSLFGDDDEVPISEIRQARQGTGSVFGDLLAKTESIQRSSELTAQATEQLVSINTDLARSLKETQAGAGAATGVAVPFVQELSRDVSRILQDAGVEISGELDNLRSRLFGEIKIFGPIGFTEQSDELEAAVQSTFDSLIDSVRAGADALGLEAGEILTTGVLRNIKISLVGLSREEALQEVQAVFGEVFDELTEKAIPVIADLAKVGEGLGETLSRVATSFEVAREAVNVVGFDVARTLGDLIPEAARKFIPAGEAVAASLIPQEELIKAADDLVQQTGGIQAFTGAIKAFENQFLSTEEQLDNSSRRINAALAEVGLTLPETREQFRDLVEGLDAVDAADREALATIFKLIPEIGSYFDKLESTNEKVGEVADGIEETVNILVELSGQIDGFFAKFGTEAVQFDRLTNQLTTALGEVGLTLPETREGMFQLGLSLDSTTESGQAAIRTLLDVQDKADQYYTILDQRADQSLNTLIKGADTALSGLRDSIANRKDELRIDFDDDVNALRTASEQYINSLKASQTDQLETVKDVEDARLNANKTALDAAKNGLQAINAEISGISSALDKLQQVTTDNEIRRSRALSVLRGALETGNLSGAGEAAGIAANVQQRDFATAIEFNRQVALTRGLLGELEDSGLEQKTAAEQTIEQLEDQTEVIRQTAKDQIESIRDNTDRAITSAQEQLDRDLEDRQEKYDGEIQKLDDMLSEYENQLAALEGIDTTVGTVESAVRDVEAALQAIQSELGVQATASETAQEPGPSATSETVQTPHPNTPIEVRDGVFRSYSSLLESNPAKLAELGYDVPGFANGGTFSGGVRTVGEVGPELEFTGPSRIVNHNDFMQAIKNDALRKEVIQLRSDMRQLMMRIEANTYKTADQLDRWDIDGLPTERTV